MADRVANPESTWRDAGSRRGARIAAKRFEVFERGRLIGGVPESATLATGNPGTPRHRVLDAPIIPSIQERQSIARRIADDEKHVALSNLRYNHIIQLECRLLRHDPCSFSSPDNPLRRLPLVEPSMPGALPAAGILAETTSRVCLVLNTTTAKSGSPARCCSLAVHSCTDAGSGSR